MRIRRIVSAATANKWARSSYEIGSCRKCEGTARSPRRRVRAYDPDAESSVFFAIAHRELGGSAEEALQVLSTEPSTLPLKATFEGVMRGDRAQTKAAALELLDDEFPDGESLYYLARALARVGELELATEAFAWAIRSFFCVPGMDRDRWIDPLRGRADFEAALASAGERHLRTVAQFESAGGRCLIDA
jgi:hypothetical protein